MRDRSSSVGAAGVLCGLAVALAACSAGSSEMQGTGPAPLRVAAAATVDAPRAGTPSSRAAQVAFGRTLVLTHGCGDCHGGFANPAADGWLAGYLTEEQAFTMMGFKTYPRNLTPDNATGIGRFSERQLFNALRYGLRPGETPDVEITSTVPGTGNFPAQPKYLAPPMPWPAFRHMRDEELWAIAAYLKDGLLPVTNRVPDSEGPPDFWAEAYGSLPIGSHPAPPFPTAREKQPR